MKNIITKLLLVILLFVILEFLTYYKKDLNNLINGKSINVVSLTSGEIPDCGDNNYAFVNYNEPKFEELDTKSYEKYSELDSFGRTGTAIANIGIDLMPNKKRTSIGMIRPSGWRTIKYDIVEGKYLYNRCHLIGYQLTGENANEKNLITCTREMNTIGMVPFENEVANYVRKTKNHVLYRVTPMYEGDNLLASGVQIEALSVEDKGEGIKFNVFVCNKQQGIEIDYKNGNSKLKES